MGIEIQAEGMASLYGQAAQLQGESVAAQREMEQTRRTADQLRDVQARQQLAEFQRELDLQREQRGMVRQAEKEERAYQWEMEKMELRSRADFAERESKRQEKRAEFDNYIKQLDKADTISPETKERLKLQAEADFAGASFSDRILFPELYQTAKKPEDKTPSRTDVDAAIKFMQEYQEKQKSWGIPFVSAAGPTKEEDVAAQYYQNILQKAGIGAAEVPPTAREITPVEDISINTRPNNEADFLATVAQLKAVDITKAKAYYDKYSGSL